LWHHLLLYEQSPGPSPWDPSKAVYVRPHLNNSYKLKKKKKRVRKRKKEEAKLRV
jgi:hypothetical protein